MNSMIRQLTIDDVAVWKEIRLEALQNHPEAFAMSYEEEILYFDEKFQEILTENWIFGAFDGKRIVASGAFALYKPKKLSHRSYFWGMYVRPEKRGSGVGKKILDAIITEASKHALQLHCSVLVGNMPAIKLYEKCGFKIYGTEHKFIKIGDRFYDEHLMALVF